MGMWMQVNSWILQLTQDANDGDGFKWRKEQGFQNVFAKYNTECQEIVAIAARIKHKRWRRQHINRYILG